MRAASLFVLALGWPGLLHAQTVEPNAGTKAAPPPASAKAPTRAWESSEAAPPPPVSAQGAAAETASADAASADAAKADAAKAADYAAVVAQAIVEFEARRWAEARALFLRAHRLLPSARTWRTLGMTSFELRDYPRSVKELGQALTSVSRALNDVQRVHVSSLLKRAGAFVGTYRLKIAPVEAALWVDSQPYAATKEPLGLSVGRHELVARAPGYQELRRRLDVQGGEDQELRIVLSPLVTQNPQAMKAAEAQPAPQPPPVAQFTPVPASSPSKAEETDRTWTWVAAGSSAILGGAAAGLWFAYDSNRDDLRDECDGTCIRDDTNTTTIDNLWTGYAATLALSVAAGAAALVLVVVESDGEQQQVSVALSPGSVALTSRF